MGLETSFLADIIENPDDDAPRLIYADWLDDSGQLDRAEFIRTQCAATMCSGESRKELMDRATAVLPKIPRSALHIPQQRPRRTSKGWSTAWVRRGFVEAVTATASDVTNYPNVLRYNPIDGINISARRYAASWSLETALASLGTRITSVLSIEGYPLFTATMLYSNRPSCYRLLLTDCSANSDGQNRLRENVLPWTHLQQVQFVLANATLTVRDLLSRDVWRHICFEVSTEEIDDLQREFPDRVCAPEAVPWEGDDLIGVQW